MSPRAMRPIAWAKGRRYTAISTSTLSFVRPRRSARTRFIPATAFYRKRRSSPRPFEKAGIIFIGPPADVISSMGDKVMARKTMAATGHLPLVPGTKEGMTDENEAFRFAREIGFPLMIKALAGGGGRGMRLVMEESEFLNLFRRAFSEASKAFGDGRLYLERYVSSPHHIEVQVIADQHGNVCHLFERECSVQTAASESH